MAPAASNLGVAQLLIVQLAAFLAALLWASGLHKLIRRDRARTVVHEFAGVPRRLAPDLYLHGLTQRSPGNLAKSESVE